MKRIHPLMASRQSADYRQPWQMSGVWRRSINFVAKSGELLTLHRRGSGFSPGGWILRGGDFDALRDVLTDGEKPQSTAAGIQIGEFLLCEPERRCSLRVPRYLASPRLNATYMQRSEETGLFGPLTVAAAQPLCPELRQFCHCFQSALAGAATDWRLWLGKGPGLTPSHDDTLTGMLLAAWYFGAIDERAGRNFFAQSGSLDRATTLVSVSYLRYAAMGYFASPLLHFIHALRRDARTETAIDGLLALGHTSGADTLLGFWLGQQIVKGYGMKTLVVALGGNALLQRGEALTAENQYRNIADAVPALARLARSYRLAIVHGNGPQVGLLALQNLAWKAVEPYPLDVLVAESQGMIGYMLAQRLALEPDMPPVTAVLTRIKVSADDPAFLEPEKFIGPVYSPEEQMALEATYGWHMKRDGKYLRRVVASPAPRQIIESAAIELLLKEGHVVICSGGGGVPVAGEGEGVEAVIDKDLAAALLAEQIAADGLIILTDADAVYEHWGTPQQRAIRQASPDELAPFAKADGAMGPKVTAVSGYVKRCGKPAWIGALSRIDDTLAGRAGTCISL